MPRMTDQGRPYSGLDMACGDLSRWVHHQGVKMAQKDLFPEMTILPNPQSQAAGFYQGMDKIKQMCASNHI